MTAIAIILLSLLTPINAVNNIRWALCNIPDGYVYQDFHSGYAVCQDTTSKKYGAIDTNGKIAIPVEYDYMGDFNGDATNVKTGEGEGIIGFDNKYLLLPDSRYKISPITTEIDSKKSTFKNSFLVVNTSDSTQAIFYKDKFITDFAPIHSLAYDVQFPFIHISIDSILNTETDDIVKYVYDMGSYFLTENAKSEIIAISHLSGENITTYVIGGNIVREETSNYINSINSDFFANDMHNINNAQSPIDQLLCTISYDNGLWKMSTKNGEIKYSLNEKDGWVCKAPFLQNMLVWFERTIPNTDSTQVKIVYYNGDEFLDKTIEGTFRLKFYPNYYHTMGYVMKAYSTAHIILTEISPEGVEVKSTIKCIIRGSSLIAKGIALSKKKFSSYTFEGGEYQVCGNYLIHKNSEEYVIYDIDKDKKIQAQEIVDYSDELILAKDLSGNYFTVSAENGKVTTLSKFQSVSSYNDNVLIAQNNDGTAVIDASGKILIQDNKNLTILGSLSSEDAIIALNKETNKTEFIYNPLAKDVLIYNTGNITEQLYTQGNTFFAKKKYNKAKRCFEMLYKHNPKDVNALIRYADCLTAQRYYSAALYYYNKALALNPKNKEAAEHLAFAQNKKEKEEHIRATIYAIASSVNDVLESTAQALNASTSYDSNDGNSSNLSRNNTNDSSNSNRNRSTYWWQLKTSYEEWERQVRDMKINPEKFDSDTYHRQRQYLQSKMKEIRNKLQQSGYTLNKSELEDWDGR